MELSRPNVYLSRVGVRPYRPQPYRPPQDDIGHSKKPNRPHGKSISATTISATKDIGHKIYGEFIWRHRDDTSRIRIVRMVNLNVKDYVSHYIT